MEFQRIVCGTDGSPAAVAAVGQAARILAPGGTLVLVAVIDGWNPLRAEHPTEAAAGQPAADAREVLERSGHLIRDVATTTRVESGWAPRTLVEVAVDEGAGLLATGMHARGRALGLVLGSVATSVLHEAPCSVLLARPTAAPDAFPRRVVVGLDRADERDPVAVVAGDLGRRFGADLRPVTAVGGLDLDDATVQELEGAHRTVLGAPVQVDRRTPVEALVDAADDADLVVVGSRSLHGLRSLGSVSERVAHRAACSVLVVRDPSRRPGG
jgi:nucleotide-binding universal stress UspA family protein